MNSSETADIGKASAAQKGAANRNGSSVFRILTAVIACCLPVIAWLAGEHHGQSQMGGAACVAGHYRMTGDNGYSRDRQRELWHQIIQHELGHTLGLPHIEDRRSLMCYADSLAEHAQTGGILLQSEWNYLDSIHNIVWDRD